METQQLQNFTFSTLAEHWQNSVHICYRNAATDALPGIKNSSSCRQSSYRSGHKAISICISNEEMPFAGNKGNNWWNTGLCQRESNYKNGCSSC